MDIFTELVKTSYEKGELKLLLSCSPEYIYDDNHKYKYTTDPTRHNLTEDMIDPISFGNLVDGIKMYFISIRKNEDEKKRFEDTVAMAVCDMLHSGNTKQMYFAEKILQIMNTQKLQDSTPKYYILNGILEKCESIIV